MCGIIGAASSRNVGKLLVQGLHKMEYRGYDSAGIALHQKDSIFNLRTLGKVQLLEDGMIQERPKSKLGIAHTRWATHGKPSQENAHPHASSGEIHIVHNGIIENYLELREQLTASGYEFTSETDSEVLAHLVESHYQGDLLEAVTTALKEVEGTYGITSMAKDPLRRDYERLLENGTKPNLARLTLARKIAAIVLAMWKNKEVYNPETYRVTDK